jgi:hypothetical protein
MHILIGIDTFAILRVNEINTLIVQFLIDIHKLLSPLIAALQILAIHVSVETPYLVVQHQDNFCHRFDTTTPRLDNSIVGIHYCVFATIDIYLTELRYGEIGIKGIFPFITRHICKVHFPILLADSTIM